ncbi:hypothetical protein [Catellatospora tritici]|uniref:hypothetical protein n=1 Tax=Catellatospora tritici TaxID=2851566 RepID=UPI001C2D8504|nr:hypothetical protein [Catellatospora tritici]MBV1854290.1 hypothetical protein [Catellatospora tritici]
MSFSFENAISAGEPTDLFETQRSTSGARPLSVVPTSTDPRGLALASLSVSRNWDGLWGMLRRHQQIYFLTVAFDVSDHPPVVFPPKEVPRDALYLVRKGEPINFSLGDGAPVFPPRVIRGGLIVYLVICEADKGARHVGNTLAQVHEQASAGGSLIQTLGAFLADPVSATAQQVVNGAAGALRAIATIMSNNSDDCVGVFTGIFPARGSWESRLNAERNGTRIELRELR